MGRVAKTEVLKTLRRDPVRPFDAVVVAKKVGRCECGLLQELADQYPQDHRACRGVKMCCSCHQEKRLDEFAKNERGRCRPCNKAYHKDYHERNKEAHNARSRAYYQKHRAKQLKQAKVRAMTRAERRRLAKRLMPPKGVHV